MDAYDLSFLEAQEIARHVPEAVLIGGWAVWCYNPRLKSRDIDVLVAPRDLWRLEAHLRGRGFSETSGTRLHKRGFRKLHEDTSVDVDIYDTVLGPYRVEELLPHSAAKALGETPVGALEPTELLALKVVAAKDRRGSEKGAKDLADLVALLSAEGRSIAWDRVVDRVPRRDLRDVLRTALSDYQTTVRLYPLPLREYKALKRSLDRLGLL